MQPRATTSQVHYFSAADDPALARRLFRFRADLFVDRLGWCLPVSDGEERDEFDRDDTVYCVLTDRDAVVGCFRAIRSDRPFLAETIFPDAAGEGTYPKHPSVWEISRFGVAVEAQRFTVARRLYAAMLRFALDRQATALVAVADEGYERFLGMIGITALRYGDPVEIGADRAGRPLRIVAGEIPMHLQHGRRYADLITLAMTLEIVHAPYVQRLAPVPA